MKSFIIKTLTLSFLLILVEYFLSLYVYPNTHVPLFIIIVCFIFAITNLIHYKLLDVAEKKMNKFNPYFLGLNMIKMFIYFIAVLIYLWFYREYALEFLISFFVVYVCFSALEVVEVTRIIKRKK